LPYAPSELTVTIGSKNQTVELIDGNEINVLKNPKLTEIKFECELPRGRQYAFANELKSPIRYTDYFEKLMLSKKPAELVITRQPPNGGVGNTTNGFVSNTWKVSLEGYDLKESAENAYDIRVSLKFKEYVEYGTVKTVTVTPPSSGNNTQPTTKPTTPTKPVSKNESYTIKSGDTLWGISRKFYGNGEKWQTIYKANEKVIEDTAKKYGKASSSNGHWIYPGTKLTIPMNT
jgi:LysM repeat protein